jgi:hypothetical protein
MDKNRNRNISDIPVCVDTDIMSLQGNSITSDIPVFLDETVKSSIKMSRRDRNILSLRDTFINAVEAFNVYMDKTEIEIYRIYRFELILISCLSGAIP